MVMYFFEVYLFILLRAMFKAGLPWHLEDAAIGHSTKSTLPATVLPLRIFYSNF